MKKSTTVILVIFLIGVLGFIGFWYWRDTLFSKQILKLEILGPDTATVGDEITYTVTYKNNGNFVLEQPKLIFDLPDNSLTEDSKTRLSMDLQDIYPGEENSVTFKTRLLGKESDVKTAHALVSYVPKNLSARYESDTTFTTKIDSVPVTMAYDLPSTLEKGKEISYTINYFSNIDYPLENLSIKVDPPAGFNFESAVPSSLDNVEWKLATLNKAQGGRITIRGTVTADTGNNVIFSAKLGMWQNGNFIVMKEVTQSIPVVNSLLFMSQQINGFSNYVASPGEHLHYQIFLRNIGSTPFDNLFVVSKIDSPAFDLSTLTSDKGSIRPNDNLIIWDSKQIPPLVHLDPGQETSVVFDVTLKKTWPVSDVDKNSTSLKNVVNVADVSQEFDTKVNSRLQLDQKTYHATQQGIENSGPIPPEANNVTTYTVTWQVKNYFNDVADAKVKAILPDGVLPTGKIMPSDQSSHFSFDSNTKEIVWLVGDLPAGSGIANSPPSISFQIALTPPLSEQGKPATLIGQATITGQDKVTLSPVSASASSEDTSLPDDQSNSGGGIVK